jgi:hypothetical protein
MRDYLCNAVFTICIQGDNLKELLDAIRKPVFVPFLGRKCCLPNYVYPTIIEAENLYDAFRRYDIAELHKDLVPILSTEEQIRIYWEGSDNSIRSVKQEWKYDHPNGNRMFRQRLEYMGYMERAA